MHARSHGFDPEELLAHTGWLRALARSLVADGSTADDLVQDAFVVALEHDGPPRKLRKWCAGVLRNLARRRRRDAGRRARREGGAARAESAGTGPGEALARADLQRRLIERVFALDEPYRTTLVLRFFEELPLEEIARRGGVPASTARTRLARALERMRRELDDEHGGDRAAWGALFAPLALRAGESATAMTTSIGWGGLGTGLKARYAVVAAVVAAGAFVWRGGGAGMDGAEPRIDATRAAVQLDAAGPGSDAAPDAESVSVAAPSDDARRPVAAPTPAAPELGVLVYGSLLGSEGTRIEGGWISFVDEGAGVESANMGAPGSYSLLGAEPGRLRITAGAPGFADATSELVIAAGVESLRHDLVLERTLEIPVRFVDETGAPFDQTAFRSPFPPLAAVATISPPPAVLPGVDGYSASIAGVGRYQGRSRSSGPIEGRGLDADHDGILRLRVAAPVYVSAVLRGTVLETRLVEGPTDEIVFRVSTEATRATLGGVRLRVIDAATHEGLAGARVALNYRDASRAGVAAGEDGSLELLDELPGLRRLEIHGGDCAPLHRWVRIEPGSVLELGDVALARVAKIAGRVVDEEGAGVSTSLTCFPVDAAGMVQDVETIGTTRSKADGSFELSAAQGRIAVVATGDEWACQPTLVDAPSERVGGVVLRVVHGIDVRFRPVAGVEGARFTLATGAGQPFLSQRLFASVPFAQRLAPGTYQVWLGWDEHVIERLTFTVPASEPGGDESLVVDLPALEPPR